MTTLTESFEAIFAQYSAAIAGMKSIGVKIGPGRTSHYEKMVAFWKDYYKTGSADGGKEICPDFESIKGSACLIMHYFKYT